MWRTADAYLGGVIDKGFEYQGERIEFASKAGGIFKPRQMSAALSIKLLDRVADGPLGIATRALVSTPKRVYFHTTWFAIGDIGPTKRLDGRLRDARH